MNTKYLHIVIIMLLTFSLISCSKDSNQSINPQQTIKGLFIDDPIDGLAYKCSSSATIFYTSTEGVYECLVWDQVTFMIDKTVIGTVQTQTEAITPYTLFPRDEAAAINLAQLLQSLDSDPNDNIITFDNTLVQKLPQEINFSSETFEQEIEAELEITLVSKKQAKKNLDESILKERGITAPIITSTTASVAENSYEGTAVGNVIITSDGGSPITAFTLSGTGSSNFDINQSGFISVASGANLDFENTSTYSLNATATNSAGTSGSVSVIISISDIDEIFQIAKLDIPNSYEKAISQSSNYTVVSAPYYDKTGIVYLYKRVSDTNISLLANITAPILEEYSHFGYALSMDGDYIAVGAPREDTNDTDSGSVYIFKRQSDTNITLVTQLTPSDPEANDEFGTAVSISGDYIAVGSPQDNTNGSNSGTVYIFKRYSDTNVTQIAKLSTSDATDNDQFGEKISMFGNYIAIRSPKVDNSTDTSSIYFFKRISDNNISEIAKISAEDIGANRESFGVSLSLYNDYLAVGDTYGDSSVSESGSAYLFKRVSDSNITTLAKLTANDAHTGYNFGNSISLSEHYIIVGSVYDEGNNPSTGSAYLFQIQADLNVSQISKLTPFDLEEYSEFGYSISLFNDYIAITGDAKAYIFNINAISQPYFYTKLTYPLYRKELYRRGPIFFFDAASPAGDISYTSLGIDGSHFEFLENQLTFLSTDTTYTTNADADYENPVDDNEDNVYELTIAATDTNGKTTTTDMSLEIYDSYTFEVASFTGNDSQVDDTFASAIAIDGNYTIIGAPGEGSDSSNSGAAYLYKKNPDQSITFITKLKSPAGDINEDDRYGSSVAIDGNYIVIGRPENADHNGSAFVYKRNDDTQSGITLIGKITGSAATGNDKFGSVVSISGDFVTVGSPKTDEDGGTDNGLAYLYHINSDTNITEEDVLSSPNSVDYNNFGLDISMDLNYIVIGSHKDKNSKGYAYLFYINDGLQANSVADINATDGTNGDDFSSSVSIDGDYIVIGAPNNDTNGSVYVFKKDVDNNIEQLAKLQGYGTSKYPLFGYSVSISNTTIAVGAIYDSSVVSYGGSVHLFEIDTSYNNVYQIDKLTPSNPTSNYNFGYAVSINGENLAIGMKGPINDPIYNPNSIKGNAYIFIKDPNQPIY